MNSDRLPSSRTDLIEVLDQVHEHVRPLIGQGKVASYMPRLACVPINRFGMAIAILNGDLFAAGDADRKGQGRRRGDAQPERFAIERHAAMTRARRPKWMFGIDVETCVRCGKAVWVIASIEELVLIARILEHVRANGEKREASLGPPSTGPPVIL